jgi:hypothetical protein
MTYFQDAWQAEKPYNSLTPLPILSTGENGCGALPI